MHLNQNDYQAVREGIIVAWLWRLFLIVTNRQSCVLCWDFVPNCRPIINGLIWLVQVCTNFIPSKLTLQQNYSNIVLFCQQNFILKIKNL
jgi:hypothetical protein